MSASGRLQGGGRPTKALHWVVVVVGGGGWSTRLGALAAGRAALPSWRALRAACCWCTEHRTGWVVVLVVLVALVVLVGSGSVAAVRRFGARAARWRPAAQLTQRGSRAGVVVRSSRACWRLGCRL